MQTINLVLANNAKISTTHNCNAVNSSFQTPTPNFRVKCNVPLNHRSTVGVMRLKRLAHLVVRRWGEHVVLQRVFGHVVGVGHHQVPAMEAGREHKRDGADPFHDGVRLRRDLRRTNELVLNKRCGFTWFVGSDVLHNSIK